jgi:hypothetical protein
VVVAVRAFQARHGLAADGVIGRETVAQLEVSPARRVRQIVLGLERLRWTPRLRAPRSIVVNVPEFMLRAYTLDGGAATLALQMRVIVGKALDTRTPLFAEDMRFIEFSPYWNVPPSIAQAELVPKLQRSPGYLARQGFEFVDGGGHVTRRWPRTGWTRCCAASCASASGRGRRTRWGTSSSCSQRRQHLPAHTLAGAVRAPAAGFQPRLHPRRGAGGAGGLRAGGHARVGRDPHPRGDGAGSSNTLRLREPLRVVIAYNTVGVAPDGRVMFHPDIYGHDAALDAALRRARRRRRREFSGRRAASGAGWRPCRSGGA